MRGRRRWLLGVLLGVALVGTLYAAAGPIGLLAPFTGDAWATADEANPGATGPSVERALTGPTTVESPHGEATVRYDDRGVPHVEAANDEALAYAVGYVHARDRLFQLDIQRRLMRGELAAAFGPEQVESDRFHRRMGFAESAEVSWEALEDESTRAGIEAYTDGVNAYMDARPLPMEFAIAGYEPDPWRPEDTLLIGTLISWGLTGSFAELEEATVRERVPGAEELYPDQLDHDAPIVREEHLEEQHRGGDAQASPGDVSRSADEHDRSGVTESHASTAPNGPNPDAADYAAIYDAVAAYEGDPGVGSNSWVVSGEHTADGVPVVANDPHLQLTVPPVWYEMHLRSPETGVRGVTLPGVPVVVIGATDDVAWGLTNVGADVLDVYEYEWVDEETYVYRGEERTVEARTESIEVAGGPDEDVEVRRTVHGPVLEEEGRRVGVAWLGLTATREAEAVHRLNRAEDVDDVREALRRFDAPTQNLVAADRHGGTLFRITGQYPVRTVDGEPVPGDRIFDGSAGEGEWEGFEPYGVSDFEGDGFVDFEAFPEVRDAPYVATANQRTMDDPPFYIARSTRYADPYRGERIYERLDERAERGEVMDRGFHTDLQRDTYSKRAEAFLPFLLEARDTGELEPRERAALDELEAWDRHKEPDSEAALIFRLWFAEYREATWGPQFGDAGLDDSYYPRDTTLETLPADSEWFDDPSRPGTQTRDDIATLALAKALEEIDREGYADYGDYNRLELTHPFPLGFMDYDRRPMAGGDATVFNFRRGADPQVGMSYRMVVDGGAWDRDQEERESADRRLDGVGTLPGGQSGNPLSPHYDDRLEPWAEGDTEPMPFEQRGPVVVRFVDDGGETEDGS